MKSSGGPKAKKSVNDEEKQDKDMAAHDIKKKTGASGDGSSMQKMEV
jgi:hypothetical protein